MTKKYNQSPLTEVVAEFNFIPSSQWNGTIPGLIYSNIKKDFPLIKQREGMIGKPIPTADPTKRMIEPVELVQFWNKTETLLIQSGKDILTINALKPYPTWEKFYPHITSAFDGYCKVANPKGLSRASLRYINTIEVPNKNFKFENNFQFQIPKPKNLNQELRYFNTHIEYNMNEVDVIAIKISNAPSSNKNLKGIILEIEVIMNKFNGMTVKGVNKWLDAAHEIINETFETSLTDTLKNSYL